MADQEFDFLVFIGRFQPFHRGHEAVVRSALNMAAHVVVLAGSAQRPRSPRNPWSFAERAAMVRGVLDASDARRTHVLPVVDATYNDELWVAAVHEAVNGVVGAVFDQVGRAPRIGLIGHASAQSGYYPRLFPEWPPVDVPGVDGLSSSDIRGALLGNSTDVLRGDALPVSVASELQDLVTRPEFADVRAEARFVADYRAQWSGAPYPPMFVTVDAVVVQSGHVLLVERKERPGRGLWALPGGFVDVHEDLQTAMLRELEEETHIDVPSSVLADAIASRVVFDDPYRSARGRTFTHAFLVRLAPGTTLPDVRGGDDARHAFWQPLKDAPPERMFEDHHSILQRMVGATH